MRSAVVVGIGTGNPLHLTGEGAEAIRAADALVVLDKGEATDDMRALRRDLVAAHRDAPLPEIVIADPVRDAELAAVDYDRAVDEWHAERSRRIAAALAEQAPETATVAFLAWGDPSLYDSTLRIIDRVRAAGLELAVRVVPGISAPIALTAAFGICANRVGESICITTGRRLASLPAEMRRNVFVMLDAHCAFRDVATADTDIYWGAYLGSADEILVTGQALEVADEIVAARAEARARHGWIMDTYLLRER